MRRQQWRRGVAVALRMVPVADGSDHGGSLRNPAAWNNVFGFRTSNGRVPSQFYDVFMPSISVHGPMARTVPDLAMFLSVIAGYDPRTPLSIREDPADFAGPLERDFKGARLGWIGDFGGHIPFDPRVLELCESCSRFSRRSDATWKRRRSTILSNAYGRVGWRCEAGKSRQSPGPAFPIPRNAH